MLSPRPATGHGSIAHKRTLLTNHTIVLRHGEFRDVAEMVVMAEEGGVLVPLEVAQTHVPARGCGTAGRVAPALTIPLASRTLPFYHSRILRSVWHP